MGLLLSLTHKIMVMIVIAIFITVRIKKKHILRAAQIYEAKGANIMFEII